MKFKAVRILTILFALTIVCKQIASAAEAELDEETQARIAREEAGPGTIDVSTYPTHLQERYPLFAEKCAACHKLSRAINSDFVLPDEWSRYIKRMTHKPASGINSSEAKKIYEFLVYDSDVRKKEVLQGKLSTLMPEERKAAEKDIQDVVDKYK